MIYFSLYLIYILEETFKLNDELTVNLLFSGGALFIKFFKFVSPISEIISYNNYIEALLPGRKEGITGETYVNYNIGIIDGLESKKKKAAIEVVKFAIRKETQKKLLLDNITVSGIDSLYDDEEVCKVVNCTLRKQLQFIARPVKAMYDYDKYSEKYRNYIYKFIYDENDNITAKEALQHVEDITKIYHISLKTEDSLVGIIFYGTSLLISILMLLSLLYLIPENYGPFFEFLSSDSWIFIVLGTVILQCSSLTMLNSLKEFKCSLKIFILSAGFSFIFIPILYKLIISFPDPNNFTDWINKHKYLFISFFIIIDLLLNGFVMFGSYYVEDMMIDDGKNYQKCMLNGIYGIITIIALFIYKGIITLVMMVLAFIEWNIQSIHSDIKFSVISMYISILSPILYFILYLTNINNYIMNFVLKECLISIMAVSNYLLLYGFRLILAFLKKQNLRLLFITNINQNFVNDESSQDISKSNQFTNKSSNCTKGTSYKIDIKNSNSCDMEESNVTSNNENSSDEIHSTTRRTSIFAKIINYHYSSDYIEDTCNQEVSATYETKLQNIAE